MMNKDRGTKVTTRTSKEQQGAARNKTKRGTRNDEQKRQQGPARNNKEQQGITRNNEGKQGTRNEERGTMNDERGKMNEE